MIIREEDLLHYGTPRHSGRYPWGSGGDLVDNPPRNKTFLQEVDELRAKGWKETDIAQSFGMSTTELRAEKSRAKNQQKQANIAMAQRLKDKGYGPSAISRRMGIPEPTVRALLAPGAKDKADVVTTTANMLKKQVAEKQFIDIGAGVEQHIGVSETMLDTAVAQLRSEGYEVHKVKMPQLGTGLDTTRKVLAPPGTTQKEVFLNRDKIQLINNFSDDGGRNFYGLHDPLKVDPKRIQIVYKEDGGAEADGMIYVRPGVKDIELGGKNYAQVRVAVGEGHYLKGMAMHKDDLPDGVDLQFHTSKSDTGNKLDVMKETTGDPNNPFGALIDRQILANPGKPDEHVTSAMNIVYEEGKWETWSRKLSSQMLSKQSPALAKSQLDMTYENRLTKHEDIKALTNPTVRKKLLEEFAAGTDASSVHLKAAALPGQATHVILPLSTIRPTHVYAPNYHNGDRVVLIRHPHGGTFEIPELIVNNRNAEGRKLLGPNAKDAIGIHHSVARWLSGADFDGDTVLVIPNNQGKVSTSPALKDLKNFDPIASYPGYPGMKPMKNTQTEMGKISNLITDMTIHGASTSELARAIKHSMVVIDAEKHNLDHRLSRNDNNIRDLEEKYQRQPDGKGGAATLISRRKSEESVLARKPRTREKGGPVDPVTGELRYEPTGQINYKTGKPREVRVLRLAETRDAHTLSSGTPIERLYANHSNKLKALANQARLDALNTPPAKWSPSAKQTYSKEVASLNAKLATAKSNAPLERHAQTVAGTIIRAARNDNPNMDKKVETKIKYMALEEARRRTGAHKTKIKITTEEWDAIQAGAISDSKLQEILNNADMDIVRAHATPKTEILMSPAKTTRATAMLASGYDRLEVARALGVSLSTLDEATKGG
jgi:hypothetical protein